MTTEPQALATSHLAHHRRSLIQDLALREGMVEVSDLAQRWGVTTETIRRDLSELQNLGLIRRIHGGAVPVATSDYEPLLLTRDDSRVGEKAAIAELAIAELGSAATVLIDAGSTTHRIAELVPTDRGIHVVTNSLRSGLAMTTRGVHPVTLLGGDVVPNTLSVADSRTVAMVRDLSVDVLFLGCDGLTPAAGMTTPSLDEQMLKRAMIESAARIVVVADSSKLGRTFLYPIAGLGKVDVLVTDAGASRDDVSRIEAQGTHVAVAHPTAHPSANPSAHPTAHPGQ